MRGASTRTGDAQVSKVHRTGRLPAMSPTSEDVLRFWFDTDPRNWFVQSDAFDAEVRERFGALHAEAAAGGRDDWRATTRGTLALLIVLDQFSRNLYRNDPRAYAQDAQALRLALELLDSGRYQELEPTERLFALLPLEHAEDLAKQERVVVECEALVREFGEGGILGPGLDYAKRHRDVIARFGRFPHRNSVLDR